jgi:NAD(P)H-dependent flavin oxidoreductase YrpB (nitropropane dioxygenase family)
VGTRFLAAAEAGADPRYVDALATAHAEDTLLTDRFAPPGVPLRARVLGVSMELDEPLIAGESTGAVRGVQPAAEIVNELATGAERLLAQAARLVEPPSARASG